VNFIEFDVEDNSVCEHDYVEVRDGGDAGAPVLARLCGHEVFSTFVSSGNQLYFTFHSDEYVSRQGFRAIISASDGNGNCHKTMICMYNYYKCIHLRRKP